VSVVLQINYVPGAAMSRWSPEQALDVARQIATVPGLHWKLWVRDETEGTCGGIYLFATEASARAWESRAKALFAGFGAIGVTAQLLSVDEAQSEATRAPLPGHHCVSGNLGQPTTLSGPTLAEEHARATP
jgi:hypothetical protein